MRNANKSSKIHHNGERNGKVVQNPYPGPDHHQKLITSRGSPVAHAHYCVRLTCLPRSPGQPQHLKYQNRI